MTKLAKLFKAWNPIARYGPCRGLTVFRFGRRKVELWVSPAWYAPPEHTHEDSDGEFLILYGKDRYIYRKVPGKPEQGYNISDRKPFKTLSVRAGTPHSFHPGKTAMVWLCFETWRKGARVTSVAEDFKLT